jgi:hypothetical protein
MFGKPGWFQPKRFGWGLTPAGWQGWVYVLVWIGVLLGPYLGCLYTAGLWPATVLEFLLIALLAADTWHILRAIKQDDQSNRR